MQVTHSRHLMYPPVVTPRLLLNLLMGLLKTDGVDYSCWLRFKHTVHMLSNKNKNFNQTNLIGELQFRSNVYLFFFVFYLINFHPVKASRATQGRYLMNEILYVRKSRR